MPYPQYGPNYGPHYGPHYEPNYEPNYDEKPTQRLEEYHTMVLHPF